MATRYDRCSKVFLSAIALAATVIFWVGDAVTGPAPRTARYVLHLLGQAVAVPVSYPKGGIRDEVAYWA